MAKLVEKPRPCIVVGNTRGIPNEDLTVGLPVKIVYEDIPGERLASTNGPTALNHTSASGPGTLLVPHSQRSCRRSFHPEGWLHGAGQRCTLRRWLE